MTETTPHDYPATTGLRAALNASQHAAEGQRRTRSAMAALIAALAAGLIAWALVAHVFPTAAAHVIEARTAAVQGLY